MAESTGLIHLRHSCTGKPWALLDGAIVMRLSALIVMAMVMSLSPINLQVNANYG